MSRGVIALMSVGAVAEGRMRSCAVGGLDILVCNVDGSVYAVENRCSHAASKLEAGRLKGHSISCPMHGARFDVRSGSPLAAPARLPIRTFETFIEGGKINIINPT